MNGWMGRRIEQGFWSGGGALELEIREGKVEREEIKMKDMLSRDEDSMASK